MKRATWCRREGREEAPDGPRPDALRGGGEIYFEHHRYVAAVALLCGVALAGSRVAQQRGVPAMLGLYALLGLWLLVASPAPIIDVCVGLGAFYVEPGGSFHLAAPSILVHLENRHRTPDSRLRVSVDLDIADASKILGASSAQPGANVLLVIDKARWNAVLPREPTVRSARANSIAPEDLSRGSSRHLFLTPVT